MAYLLGWKDILRPIRDGYRHLFPSPDTGPTPEERQRQRAVDQWKGFTYFDTFEQLETWSEASIDSLQRANTPILTRFVSQRDVLGKARILLCHDYGGNYHEYEGVSNTGLDEEKYACEYLQFVDTFIYFSHKLVCVPPPTWINTLHRNGVKALGTILIEPQTSESERLLQHGDDGLSFPLAKKLADIANAYGFDGWLVNIEKPFPKVSWNAQIMEAFICQLKSDLGAGKELIWYDALTTSNRVSYQNSLNASNLTFASACGSILTNYSWKEGDAAKSVHEALRTDLKLQNVYFGIDVWAQNTTQISHPRITYPECGGGGTNTGAAVAKLAELGLSAGIFAPAWTFEHFPGYGRDVEQTMWHAADLPEGLTCSCGDCARRHQPNQIAPVARSARQHSAGSESFFFTDFSRAIGTHGGKEKDLLYSGFARHAQLGYQSILPLRTGSPSTMDPLQYHFENVSGQTKLVVEAHMVPCIPAKDLLVPERSWSLPLYRLDMPADGSLQLSVSYRDLTDRPGCIFFHVKISGIEHSFATRSSGSTHELDVVIGESSLLGADPRLEEIGFHSNVFDLEATTRLAEVDYICIQPIASAMSLETHNIANIHTLSKGEGEAQHLRLCWSHTFSGRLVDGIPYSRDTGSISYFTIHVDGLNLGRAYATEHILVASFVEQIVKREVAVGITGVGFNGQELANATKMLQIQRRNS